MPLAELMVDFYRRMLGGQSAARALRGAMLSVREQHPHPRDWAAFTVTGVGGLAEPAEVAVSGRALRERP